MNTIRIGIVMDPVGSIKIAKDTTFAFMLEAQRRGWQISYLEMGDLYLQDGTAMGHLRRLEVTDEPANWFSITGEEYGPLSQLDVILMRKDPPFDIEYVMATYILERAEMEGVLVVNRPRSLRDANEKVFTAWFPHCCPPSLLTRSKGAIRDFLEKHHKIVVKPTDMMGGRSVFVIQQGDPNTQVILEETTRSGTRYVQAQAYVPEIETTGDKRIILIDGLPVEAGIARNPAGGDHRGNLAAGATATGFTLTERDRWICREIGPVLKDRGLLFVGIDVIGDYLTEINVTSPTGIREIDARFHLDIASRFLDMINERLPQRPAVQR